MFPRRRSCKNKKLLIATNWLQSQPFGNITSSQDKKVSQLMWTIYVLIFITCANSSLCGVSFKHCSTESTFAKSLKERIHSTPIMFFLLSFLFLFLQGRVEEFVLFKNVNVNKLQKKRWRFPSTNQAWKSLISIRAWINLMQAWRSTFPTTYVYSCPSYRLTVVATQESTEEISLV